MELVSGEFSSNGPIGLLPGSFHPPTVAHLGLANAALARVETVVFVLPRAFPHKRYEGVGQSERLAILSKLTAGNPRFTVALSDGGLFVEMVREVKRLLPPVKNVFVVCGRDAAERVVSWPYPPTDPIEGQLDHYRLLVAERQGEFSPPPRLADRIETLITAFDGDAVSSTSVRNAIGQNQPWSDLVPSQIHEIVKAVYSPSRFDSRNVRNR